MSLEIAGRLIQELRGADPETVLRLSTEFFADKLVFASALGAEDQVITDMIWRNGLKIPIVTLDTARWFNETYQLLAETEQQYGIKLQLYFPEYTAVETMIKEKGINLFLESIENRKRCCRVRKIEPLQRALAGYSSWICGLRREQAVTRNEIEVVEWDAAHEMVKINPLAAWSEADVWEYIGKYSVPYNKLHDHGFPSIGCACCTRAVKRTEDVRAGRWWWETPEQKECGLHLVDGKLVRNNNNNTDKTVS
jgi:phosphoadenosine phosphosulfate reductase